VALANALHHEFGAHIALLGGAEDQDVVTACRDALAQPEWVEPARGPRALRAFARELADFDLFIGNDAFPMHLAAAAGTPVIAIFGLSNHRAWHPLARDAATPALVVRRDLPCSPCFYVGHHLGTPQGCAARSCLTELDIAPVMTQVRRVLRRSGAAHRPLPSSTP
jgi:heptosyltransferase-2